jgi:aerobic carbon-monoxide dehydrogenase medium subunit
MFAARSFAIGAIARARVLLGSRGDERGRVRPAPFVYHAPDDLDAAIALLGEHGDDAKVLAGGQSLVPMLALRLATPGHLVDLGGIAALSTLTFGHGLRIGAGVTQRALERSPDAASACPLLAAALPYIAHPPIRTRGTVCGSLAHADPAAELPAVMLALDATMIVRGIAGERAVPAGEFFSSYLETVIAADEVLVAVDVPPWPDRTGWAFAEISRRSGDFAIAGVAALVTVRGGLVTRARLACCGVASTPVRLFEGEAMLLGRALDASTISEIASAAVAGLDPPSDVHAPGSYRRHVTSVLLERALTTAAGRTGEAE